MFFFFFVYVCRVVLGTLVDFAVDDSEILVTARQLHWSRIHIQSPVERAYCKILLHVIFTAKPIFSLMLLMRVTRYVCLWFLLWCKCVVCA